MDGDEMVVVYIHMGGQPAFSSPLHPPPHLPFPPFAFDFIGVCGLCRQRSFWGWVGFVGAGDVGGSGAAGPR